MRPVLSLIFLVFVCLVSTPAAFAISVDQVPNPRHQNMWVSDTVGVIDAQTERRINAELHRLERDTGAEVAVVTVEQVDTATPKDFATQLFNRWGIGKAGSDNGLLILLVRGERRLEMETGYGLESVLTDGWLKRMQVDKMVPYFKQGRFGKGLEAGVLASVERLRRFSPGSPGSFGTQRSQSSHTFPSYGGSPEPSGDKGPLGGLLQLFMFGSLVVLGVGVAIYKHRRDRTCPTCNVRMSMLSEQADDEHLTEGQRTEEMIGSVDYQLWYCEQCDFDRMLQKGKWFSGYSRCPECRHKTLDVDTMTTRHPTTTRTGRKRVISDCAHCSHHSVRYISIPRRTSSSSGSSGGGFGGGGGSSFGGGSSGGGGAGSSW